MGVSSKPKTPPFGIHCTVAVTEHSKTATYSTDFDPAPVVKEAPWRLGPRVSSPTCTCRSDPVKNKWPQAGADAFFGAGVSSSVPGHFVEHEVGDHEAQCTCGGKWRGDFERIEEELLAGLG